MLKWISEKVENARIAWSFPDYEKAKREEHLAAADHRFSSAGIEREIAELAQGPTREAAIKFGPQEASLNADITANRKLVEQLRQKLAVLERSYKDELDCLYRKVADAKISIDALYEEKSDAHEAIRDAKSSIDHWYRMSDCYLGNKGREIPKSRIFGRSQNDLEYYKSQKASAISSLRDCQEEIEKLKYNRASYFKEIEAIKDERRYMYKLKSEGATVPDVKSSISEIVSSMSKLETSLREIKADRDRFVQVSRIKLGIPEREREVDRIKTARLEYIKSFDSDVSVAQREQQHRLEWLTRHSEKRKRAG